MSFNTVVNTIPIKLGIFPSSWKVPLHPFLVNPSPEATAFWLLWPYLNLASSWTSYKWKYTVFCVCVLASLAERNIFEIHTYCWVYQWLIPFLLLSINCMHIPQFIYPFTYWWAFGLFPAWELLWMKLLQTFFYSSFSVHVFYFTFYDRSKISGS